MRAWSRALRGRIKRRNNVADKPASFVSIHCCNYVQRRLAYADVEPARRGRFTQLTVELKEQGALAIGLEAHRLECAHCYRRMAGMRSPHHTGQHKRHLPKR